MKVVIIKPFEHIGMAYNIGDIVEIKDKNKDCYNIISKNSQITYSTWIRKNWLNAHSNKII